MRVIYQSDNFREFDSLEECIQYEKEEYLKIVKHKGNYQCLPFQWNINAIIADTFGLRSAIILAICLSSKKFNRLSLLCSKEYCDDLSFNKIQYLTGFSEISIRNAVKPLIKANFINIGKEEIVSINEHEINSFLEDIDNFHS